ncbi:MAG: acylneuraminate cytidylyltransferase family protein [Thermoproteota archaeon]
MKTICFIGARGGSKGVPRKNIKMLNNKPLIAHTIESALDSKIFSHVIVSTEDPQIAKIAARYGAEVPFMRPKKLATDSAGFADVLLHGINELYKQGYKFDTLVNRDCTVPFIRISDMRGAVRLLKNKKCDAVYAVYKQHFNPYFNMMEKDSSGFLKLCKKLKVRPRSRQEAPTVYQLNGLFVYDVDRFLKYKSAILPRSLPYEIPSECGLMIDTELEFQIAEMMLKKRLAPA